VFKGVLVVYLCTKNAVFQGGEGNGMDEDRVGEDGNICIVILSLVVVRMVQKVVGFILSAWFVD
jgi:hypothetical protein